jgi:N-acetylmuramoyl-L-alanine amidase
LPRSAQKCEEGPNLRQWTLGVAIGSIFCVAALFCSTLTFTSAAEASDHNNSAQPLAKPTAEDHCESNMRIALDVGHTPELYGTRTARGRTEYEFNLNLAEAIRSTLTKSGIKDVFLITMRGGLDTLERRDLEANELKANLFISLHHDSVAPAYLKNWIVNGRVEQYSDDFSGYSLFVSEKNPYWRHSLVFATLLSDELLARSMHFTLHHVEQEGRELLDKNRGVYRYDGLVVLKHFNGPAVLFEAAVVVNKDEEVVADTAERHQLIADAMLNAIKKFCSVRGRPPSQSQ